MSGHGQVMNPKRNEPLLQVSMTGHRRTGKSEVQFIFAMDLSYKICQNQKVLLGQLAAMRAQSWTEIQFVHNWHV